MTATDATHTELPVIQLEMPRTEEQQRRFDDEYVVKQLGDDWEVEIPGGLTQAHGTVACRENSDGWQKELFKLGMTSITVEDNPGLSIFAHRIRIETDGQPADW